MTVKDPAWARGTPPPRSYATWREWVHALTRSLTYAMMDGAQDDRVEERTDPDTGSTTVTFHDGLRPVNARRLRREARLVVHDALEDAMILERVDWRSAAILVAGRAQDTLVRRGYALEEDEF